ncbi:MAG: CHAT domain-containing protein, partial [Cyanobacteria bacterium P01_D01_bin.116]
NVDDYATFGLMSEFYHQLKEAPIKSEALQKAQIAMLKGEIWQENGKLNTTIGTENGKLYTARNRDVISIEVVQPKSQPPSPKLPKFTHPYYWAAFTMIGNPW